MGKWEIRPLATPKPLTDRHQKLHMRLCRGLVDIYPHAKFSHDPLRGFFSREHEIAHQNVYSASFFGFFQRPTAEAPELIFMHNMSNDVVPHKDMPFRS